MKKIYLSTAFLLAIILIVAIWIVPRFTTPNGKSDKGNLIQATSPIAGSIIKSPLKIIGKARGFWFFEASFPARLLDGDGKEIAVMPVQATDEWMTEEFVPFSAELEFNEPKTDSGTLVLQKDNPSGLPEHDDELRIPVRFR